MTPLDGGAVVYCDGAFNTPNGKTAHGLVRFTRRYAVLSVIDTRYAGSDAGEVLDRRPRGIPVVADLRAALALPSGREATHFVVGIAPDGGRLTPAMRSAILEAIGLGLDVDCGLHDFLEDDPEISAAAAAAGVTLRDARRTPDRKDLHGFTGKIEEVDALTIAILGTDSAVGKRTTAWALVLGLEEAGLRAEMVGTGQTAWMQGARFGLLLDSVVSDFMAGEIEHAVWSAWKEARPDVIVIEGQGSLLNPAYPGGNEILAAGRPDLVIMQHAPARVEYDGFPGYRIHPLAEQIEVVERISRKPVIAVTVNHENLDPATLPLVCRTIEQIVGRPTFDVLEHGAAGLVEVVRSHLPGR
jgi:uncharacterized NAD-dependent epimerase/dehydratase family protein